MPYVRQILCLYTGRRTRFTFQSVVYTPKNLQLVNKMCSHCLFPVVDKSGTSCYHLVTRLMRPTDLQQVVLTSLISSARNQLLTSLSCWNNMQQVYYRHQHMRQGLGFRYCRSVSVAHYKTLQSAFYIKKICAHNANGNG
jgi:hypothetical protein